MLICINFDIYSNQNLDIDMRKFIMLLSLLSFTILAVAQNQVNFKLQADASFKTEDGKNFIVIPFEGKTAQELYAIVKKNVTTTYYSAKNVLNTVENELISINGITSQGVIPYEIMSRTHAGRTPVSNRKEAKSNLSNKENNNCVYYPIQYVLTFRFKDGKIRIDAPEILRLLPPTLTSERQLFSGNYKTESEDVKEWLIKERIFNKNGTPNPNRQMTITGLENFVNNHCTNLMTTKNEDW